VSFHFFLITFFKGAVTAGIFFLAGFAAALRTVFLAGVDLTGSAGLTTAITGAGVMSKPFNQFHKFAMMLSFSGFYA
jgi:hypothetical protein